MTGWDDIGSGWKASPEESHTFTEREMKLISENAELRKKLKAAVRAQEGYYKENQRLKRTLASNQESEPE